MGNVTSSDEELDSLYNPSIQDLELDEHQGKDRPVVYLDDAKATIQAHQSRAVEIAALEARIDELRNEKLKFDRIDVELYANGRIAELEAQLATLTKDKGEDRE